MILGEPPQHKSEAMARLPVRYARWLFWTVVYAFRRDTNALDVWIRKFERTRKPWWKFKPFVFRSDNGNTWEVCWSDQRTYTRRCCIPDCEVEMDIETGQVVGVKLFDEILADGRKLPDWFGPNRDRSKSA